MKTNLSFGLLLMGLAACGGQRSAPDGTSDASAMNAATIPEVHFTAKDFAFEGPDTLEAGMTTLVLTNASETWHHLQLIRLPDGMSMQDFGEAMAHMHPGAPAPPWFVEAGGVNPPSPGAPARVTMLLEPGEYAVLCLVDTPDRVPHVMKGMVKPLTVTASDRPTQPLPKSDLTLTLVDYAFSFSVPPTRGTHVIRVENSATQAHEIALFRLHPGKTMADVEAWSEAYEGPPPMTPVGGVPAFRPGQVADMYVTLTPGDYVALCFVPDHNDGIPHLMHGMVLPFTIS